MEKRLLQLLALVGGLVLLWFIWRPFWRLDLNEAPKPNSEDRIVFEIERGSSARSIAKELAQQNLIVHRKSFLKAVETESLSEQLRYGSFVLSPSMTLREVITILTTEGSGEIVFTILEGWTISDIDAALHEAGLAREGEFIACSENCEFDYDFLEEDSSLEGFLFPDTYFINGSSFSTESFINQLLSTFNQRLTDEHRQAIAESGRSIQDTIIVASMIEKEVRTTNDIPLVGGIIWKRLDKGWQLGIDATLLYVQDDNILTVEDLADDSPYNTRIYRGLPPTAISNPGLASIEGAVYPEDSDYWFYLTTLDTGEVIYAETNAQHEQNKAEYL